MKNINIKLETQITVFGDKNQYCNDDNENCKYFKYNYVGICSLFNTPLMEKDVSTRFISVRCDECLNSEVNLMV